MKTSIVLLGAPGSGKGTQAEFIIKKTGFSYISAGDILRRHLREQTPIAKQIKAIVDKGHLIPDSLITEIIKQEISSLNTSVGFLFDGFPRTIVQAENLDCILKEINSTSLKVIQIEVTDEQELMNRILKRSQEQNRADDTADVIKNRLQVYHKQTYPLLSYYKQRNQLFVIDGSKSVDEVKADVLTLIESDNES